MPLSSGSEFILQKLFGFFFAQVFQLLDHPFLNKRSQLEDSGFPKEFAQWQLDAERPAKARHEPRRQNRVAAQLEKVIVNAHLIQSKYVLPEFDQSRLSRVLRRRENLPQLRSRCIGNRERATVELAVG